MNKVLIYLSLFIPSIALAELPIDAEFRTSGIVDKNFKIIDMQKYKEIWRTTSNELGEMMPMQLDENTRVLSLIINKDLYSMTMQVNYDGDNLRIDQRYLDTAKNNFCSTPYGMSEVIRKNGGMTINVIMMNNNYKIIYNHSFHSSECPKLNKKPSN